MMTSQVSQLIKSSKDTSVFKNALFLCTFPLQLRSSPSQEIISIYKYRMSHTKGSTGLSRFAFFLFWISCSESLFARLIDGPLHGYKKTSNIIDTSISHRIIFAVRQQNIDVLKSKLYQISDPVSPLYGQYLTSSEIAEISSNKRGHDILNAHLLAIGAVIEHETLHGEFVIALAPISTWETFFSTKFALYQDFQNENMIYRATHYTLHENIAEHVMGVFNLIHFPMKSSSGKTFMTKTQGAQAFAHTITPSKLNSYYNIFSNNGSMDVTQTIYSSLDQSFSSTDLAAFQSTFNIPSHPVDADPNDRDDPFICDEFPSNCAESSLDIQYITAIAQNTFTSVM